MRRLLIPLLVASTLLAACSDSGDDEAAPEEDTEYCQAILGIQGLGVSTNTEAVELIEELQSVAPPEYEADLELLLTTVSEMAASDPDGQPTAGLVMAQSGDLPKQQEIQQALARLTESAEQDCGFDPEATAPTTTPDDGDDESPDDTDTESSETTEAE
jgi:hypothetical protein